MQVVTRSAEVQARCLAWRAEGLRVGFVPTMGFLHRGHSSLMDLAARHCDRLVVSIYVNPIQFGPGEDLDRYPRDPEGDSATCEAHGCDLLFTPESLYPPGFSTRVVLSGVTEGLCGSRRPGHFEGVTTVVARLFGIVQPHVAVFGEKDYQQLQVLRTMARDLAMPIEVLGGALIRDEDGLALSSRNAYLDADERRRGLTLHRALFAMRDSGLQDVEELKALGRSVLEVDEIDYLEVVDARDLTPLTHVDRPARALVAAFVGKTRLIDNVGI